MSFDNSLLRRVLPGWRRGACARRRRGLTLARGSLAKQTGLTMIEVLVSVVVLAIIITPTFDAMVRGRLLVMHRGEERAALRLVERKAEQLLAAGYNSAGSDTDISSTNLVDGTHPTNGAILLISRGDSDPSNDVIGDLSWTVTTVAWTDPLGASNDTEYKSIEIKLRWPLGAVRDSVVLNTITS